MSRLNQPCYTDREGPELYVKTIMRISLYVSTQLKNGSDIKKMPYAREASEALGTQTGRKSYHARQESM